MLIPKDNEKDLADIPDIVKKGLEIIPVSNVDEVLERALASPMTPIEWTEADQAEATALASRSGDDAGSGLVKH